MATQQCFNNRMRFTRRTKSRVQSLITGTVAAASENGVTVYEIDNGYDQHR